MTSKQKLNDKQTRFCHEYVIDHNATQAAIRAGYSKKTAGSIGQRLLKNVEIASLIQRLDAKNFQECEVNARWVVNKWKQIIEVGTTTASFEKDGVEVMRMVDPMNANTALSNLAKHLRMFERDDQSEDVDDSTGVLVVDQVPSKEQWQK